MAARVRRRRSVGARDRPPAVDLVARGRARDRRRRGRRRRQPRPFPRRPRGGGREASERGQAPALPGRRGRERVAPDRLRRVELRRGRDRGRRAARRTAARVRRSARRAPAAWRGLAGNDPRRGRGRARRRPQRDHGARRRHRARHPARRCAADPRPGIGRDGDDEPCRPAVDDRAGARGGDVVRRGAAPTRARRPADPAPGMAGGAGRRSRRLPALHRPGVQGRRGGTVSRVAARAPPRRRDAPDLERRRRHELRHARLRQPPARLRPSEARGRGDRRAAGAGR